MVLIKVADISNEARPMEVAEPWLDKLLQEFFTQSDAEKQEGLPVTPFMDRDKITKPSSQCSFIGFVLLPLFEALGQLFQEIQPMIVEPVRYALDYYRRLNEAAKDEQRMHRKSIINADFSSIENSISSVPNSPTKSAASNDISKSFSGTNVRKPSICFSQARIDEVSGAEDTLGSEEILADLSEDSEEEEETVTEVAVSEKTLKFKISTESSSSGRKSYPGSRKGSRERTNQLGEQELARVLREQERSIRSSDSGEKRSWSSSEQPSEERRCGKCGNAEDSKEIRSHSLADQDWRHDFVTGQFGKRNRSISAGSPEGLREFRGKDFREGVPRRMSPSSPKDCDDASKEVASLDESSDGKDIEHSLKGGCLGIIKEGFIPGVDEIDELKEDILIIVNGSNELASDQTAHASDLQNSSHEDLKEEPKESDIFPENKVQRKSPSSFLRRLKNFSDRFSKSSSADLGSPKSSHDRAILIPASPASLKAHKIDSKVSLENERRAMTLPKTSKKKVQTKREKGWKLLLKSKSSVGKESENLTKEEGASCSETSERECDERVANGLTPPDEIIGSCMVDCSGVHNNNRNKQIQQKLEEENSSSCQHRGHWMSSLVSTFRSRKSHDKEESAKT